MALIGTNTITAIARHFILPQITDQIYQSNILLKRIMQGNKRMVQGGTHIEVPLMYGRWSNGGAYTGMDQFNPLPQDTIKNATFNWKQHQVSWAVDGLTLIRADSPDAIANFLTLQSQQAYMEIAENLANGLLANDGLSNPKDIDGLPGLVGAGSSIGNQNYGGLDRTTNTYWDSSVTGITSTQTMSMVNLMAGFTGATRGGQHPTLIISGQDQWNRYWALNAATPNQINYPRQPQGHDALNASGGFTNLLFNNVPWVVDSHVTANIVSAAFSRVYMLNENFFHWIVSPRVDFYLKPFQEPHDMDAMVSSILWGGNFVCTNPDAQGGVFNFNA